MKSIALLFAFLIAPGLADAGISASDFMADGDARQAGGRLEDAIADYSSAIKLEPENARAYCGRGAAKRADGDWKGAVADYTRAIRLDPKNIVAYYNRGIARRAAGDFWGAVDDYTHVIELDPKNALAYASRADAERDTLYEERESDLARAAKLDPNFATGERGQGNPNRPLCGMEIILAECDRKIELHPESAAAYCNRGAAKLTVGDEQGASGDISRAMALDPKLAPAYYYRGEIEIDRNETARIYSFYHDPIADYHHAIRLDPKYANAYYRLGRMKTEAHDHKGALADYDRAIACDSENAGFYFDRGNEKLFHDELEGAIADFSSVIALNPENRLDGIFGFARTNRASAKDSKGDYDGAIADYAFLLKLAPKFINVRDSLINTEENKGDLDAALAECDKAIELDPASAPACWNRGEVKILMRNWTGALDDYQRGCKLSESDDDRARLAMWCIRVRLGETEAAGTELSDYLDRDLNIKQGENRWISNIAGHLLGNITEAGLFAAAKSADDETKDGDSHRCEAWFYAGLKKLFSGDRKTAKIYFHKCLSLNPRFHLAHYELKALEKQPANAGQ